MDRLYDELLSVHLSALRQMAFLSGPRQVGKTTSAKCQGDAYLNWDSVSHQMTFLHGAEALGELAGLDQFREGLPVVVFDDLPNYPHWKKTLKGFFDVYENRCKVVVTGSSKMESSRRGGDSLEGRYFSYRMHPFSVAELMDTNLPGERLIRPPKALGTDEWEALWLHGGFPEPLSKASGRFSRIWQDLRFGQLFKEDIRDMTRIQELPLVGVLGRILAGRSSEQLIVATLAKDVGVAPNTVKAWIQAFCSLHAGFLVRPWSENIAKSLRKEPKWFLRDWSGIGDPGRRAETFVACHLLKAVEGWEDLGYGKFELCYLRDTQKREVDFAVIRDGEPWFLVDVKAAEGKLSPSLAFFQKQTGAKHAFQVVIEAGYADMDCFTRETPTIVPARTLLSQFL
jgi:predicted AAA+ superfamily ATPase